MKETIELKKYKCSGIVINPELNKYESIVTFPEKLKEANETLAKYGLPEGWEKKPDIKVQPAFWMSGILKEADANSNIFLIIATDNGVQTHYPIKTTSKILDQLVKAFWNEPIKVHIRPQINANNLFEYELIEVNVSNYPSV
jgi:hypothetical protein